MLFNSLLYILFFFVTVSIYFYIPQRFRWVFLLCAGYYFYMCWRPQYIWIVLFVTIVSFIFGIVIGRNSESRLRKPYLAVAIVLLFIPLVYYKYANFFIDFLNGLLPMLGLRYTLLPFAIVLPIGISFYTFQAVSYLIDVSQKKINPEHHVGIFALFKCFFPQLVAGPIERAGHLLPQLRKNTAFEYIRVMEGMKRILWGLFKKVVIADRLALYVNEVYNNGGDYTGVPLIIATYFFTFQIYCDFSGYTDIAIGSAKVLGFDLVENFNTPYFSQSIPEFWRRWHMSLTTWFRDYVYIPLGGNKCSTGRRYLNVLITFTLCGFWHGANWTFIFWGVLHSLYYVGSVIKRGVSSKIEKLYPDNRLIIFFRTIVTFHLVAFGWIFFRSSNIFDAFLFIKNMGIDPLNLHNIYAGLGLGNLVVSMSLILFLLGWEYIRKIKVTVIFGDRIVPALRILGYSILIVAFFLLGVFEGSDFLYFQF